MNDLDRGAIAFQAGLSRETDYIVTRKQLVHALAQIKLRPDLISGREEVMPLDAAEQPMRCSDDSSAFVDVPRLADTCSVAAGEATRHLPCQGTVARSRKSGDGPGPGHPDWPSPEPQAMGAVKV